MQGGVQQAETSLTISFDCIGRDRRDIPWPLLVPQSHCRNSQDQGVKLGRWEMRANPTQTLRDVRAELFEPFWVGHVHAMN